VLYPTVMREVLVGCAGAGLYEPRWSARILEEWARATVKLGPGEEAIARGEIASLRAAWPKAEVPVAAGLEQRLWLPDANDIHVLAAAVAGSCDLIVTSNAKDFPRGLLAEEGLARTDPDLFVLGLFDVTPGAVREVVDRIVAEAVRLSGQDWTPRGLLKKARMPQLGKALSRVA
jgi:hypothetical protein